MKSVLLLGATGSIGTTFLTALRNHPELDIRIAGMTASSNKALEQLGRKFNAPYFYLQGADCFKLKAIIDETKPDIILNAIAGTDGLTASAEALDLGLDLALANKESIVLGGHFLLDKAKDNNARIIPVDSEHSAIYHLLKGKKAERLIITASGGPFRTRENLEDVTIQEALNHPTWKMGKKITIDSATLANKGLEVIEASLLFGFPPEKIDVTVHPQSIIHSMIETAEGAVYALMSPPDMTLPILTAIIEEGSGMKDIVKPLSFSSGLSLTFSPWDRKRFPMLEYAYEALRQGSGYRIAYASADETAVNAFLNGRIGFMDIARITKEVLSSDYPASEPDTLEEILEIPNLIHSKRSLKYGRMQRERLKLYADISSVPSVRTSCHRLCYLPS